MLSKVMENVGRYGMKNSITQWYGNALQPMRCKKQSLELSNNSYVIKLKQRMFYLWFSKYNSRINSYEAKTEAVKQIC
jgi:hypothetical protein